jgi:hypothetical protein
MGGWLVGWFPQQQSRVPSHHFSPFNSSLTNYWCVREKSSWQQQQELGAYTRTHNIHIYIERIGRCSCCVLLPLLSLSSSFLIASLLFYYYYTCVVVVVVVLMVYVDSAAALLTRRRHSCGRRQQQNSEFRILRSPSAAIATVLSVLFFSLASSTAERERESVEAVGCWFVAC